LARPPKQVRFNPGTDEHPSNSHRRSVQLRLFRIGREMAKHNTGQLIGSIYDTVGCSNKASTDQITKASQRYSETARNPDCPAITEAVATEITRIVSSPGVRATYDQGLAIGNPWPIDLPLTVRIGTVGISPLVETKFCDRCRAFSAKDITNPSLPANWNRISSRRRTSQTNAVSTRRVTLYRSSL
jgi:hypothetical protein